MRATGSEDAEIVLVGRKEEIEKYLGEDRSNIEIVDARDDYYNGG